MSHISEAREWLEKIKRLHEYGGDNCCRQAMRFKSELADIYKKSKQKDKESIHDLVIEANALVAEIEKRETEKLSG